MYGEPARRAGRRRAPGPGISPGTGRRAATDRRATKHADQKRRLDIALGIVHTPPNPRRSGGRVVREQPWAECGGSGREEVVESGGDQAGGFQALHVRSAGELAVEGTGDTVRDLPHDGRGRGGVQLTGGDEGGQVGPGQAVLYREVLEGAPRTGPVGRVAAQAALPGVADAPAVHRQRRRGEPAGQGRTRLGGHALLLRRGGAVLEGGGRVVGRGQQGGW